MNLLSLILKSLLTDDTLAALVKKTGLSKAILKKLIPLAIPLLIKFMTNNASSQAGALSLLNALGQHTSKKSLADQIAEANTTDGSKILGILLPAKAYYTLMRYERYGMMLLVLLLLVGALDGPLQLLQQGLVDGLLAVSEPVAYAIAGA